MPSLEESTGNTLYCSFCGKSQHDVKKLVAGPTVFICDECIVLCVGIICRENGIPEFELDELEAAVKTAREKIASSQARLIGASGTA